MGLAVNIQTEKNHAINTAGGSGFGTHNTKLYSNLDFIVPWQNAGQKRTPISTVYTIISNSSVERNTKNCSPWVLLVFIVYCSGF